MYIFSSILFFSLSNCRSFLHPFFYFVSTSTLSCPSIYWSPVHRQVVFNKSTLPFKPTSIFWFYCSLYIFPSILLSSLHIQLPFLLPPFLLLHLHLHSLMSILVHLFKLINGSFFHSYFHSFMYRVYIEGNHHSKNGK